MLTYSEGYLKSNACFLSTFLKTKQSGNETSITPLFNFHQFNVAATNSRTI